MKNLTKKAIVVHSGGMDSSICLGLAVEEWGSAHVLSLSFQYGQRHAEELDRAKVVADHLEVDHLSVPVSCFSSLTHNALLDSTVPIEHQVGVAPNTLVVGRNGFMMRMSAVHGHSLGCRRIYLGIIEVESANSGYRDCSRVYADKMEDILRLDLNDPDFQIITPLVFMTKKQTLEVAYRLGILSFLLETTITCYEGLDKVGCRSCPACKLRNQGLLQFVQDHPEFTFSFKDQL